MKITIRDAGKVRIIDLSGTLDLGSSVAVHAAVKQLLDQGHARIVFNIKHVPWIDTSGITCLVASRKRALDRGGDVVLLKPGGKTARILRSCLIQTYIKFYDDELTAVGSLETLIAPASLDRKEERASH